MALPGPNDIRLELEGFPVSCDDISDAWINRNILTEVVPYIEKYIRQTINQITQYVDYYDGNGEDVLTLSRRPIIQLIRLEFVGGSIYPISAASVEVITTDGMLKARSNIYEGSFRRLFDKGEKNIKVTYTAGYTDPPVDLKNAIIYLTASNVLGQIGNRTGGGPSLTVQAHSREFGERGKYGIYRSELVRKARFIIQKYFTGVSQ